jgi:hypothetical protein
MVHVVATGLKGHGSVIEFRPSVNSDMRLGNRNGTTNPPRFKGIKRVPYHFSSHEIGCLQHPLLNLLFMEKLLVIALIEVYENEI